VELAKLAKPCANRFGGFLSENGSGRARQEIMTFSRATGSNGSL
jgi:hypothetical protein